MKKYLLILAVILATAFTSCTNEDITVQKVVTLEINPTPIVSSYYEVKSGDLTKLEGNTKLHIRALIYNMNGELLSEQDSEVADYNSLCTMQLTLPEGEYFTVVSSSIVMDDNIEYWTVEGAKYYTDLRFVKNDNYTSGKNAILGMAYGTFKVTSDDENAYVIPLKTAGALIICQIKNWDALGSVKEFDFNSLGYNDVFGLNSNLSPLYERRDGSGQLIRFLYNSKYIGMYGYVFVLPTEDAYCNWSVISNDNSSKMLSGGISIQNLRLGKQYYFEYDVEAASAKWNIYNDIDATSAGPASRSGVEPELIPCGPNRDGVSTPKPAVLNAADFVEMTGGLQKLN